MAESRRDFEWLRPWRRRIVFAACIRDRSGDALHRTISWHCPWICLHPIGDNYPFDVRRHRRGNERPLPPPYRATSLVNVSAETRDVDGARETVDGISSNCDAALSPVRAWRAARRFRLDLGFGLSARGE